MGWDEVREGSLKNYFVLRGHLMGYLPLDEVFNPYAELSSLPVS